MCPQVSNSLQSPEQEAALLLEAEGLLLLQRCLLPAPHAVLVPGEPQPHRHTPTLRTHPLAQRSRSEGQHHTQHNTCSLRCCKPRSVLCLRQIYQYQTVLVTAGAQTSSWMLTISTTSGMPDRPSPPPTGQAQTYGLCIQ